ncbi:11-beta-hydroxysteroid dehydrogenase 1A [Striga hermonthica]|uniref:11-beta-hydroxysteroid dehydrogenase 1A n=1 Tax=Striga hermonthica TaxID=68872 RepID=A0A9N7NJL5_STRHE|nr:11-beta-hydroxysteroid dehydrogenase 1A [Striga hermonthica]
MIELIHTFLNLAAPPFTFFSLLFLLPPFQVFKFCLSVLGTLFSEDVAGKVVLITGASSGIGESLAYEYAKRGAFLVLATRREGSLGRGLQRIVDHTMNHFGRLDHLVNNAGISSVAMLEEVDDVTDFRAVMDVNFWGCVYMTRFAVPYLRNSRGRIVVISSSASWLPSPRMSIYNASKAAISQFFETLRVEFGPDIGITLVTPGYIESELTQGKFYTKVGKLEVDQDMRDVQLSLMPVLGAERCAKAIVRSAVRGERYLTVPAWFRVTYLWKLFFPEVVEWSFRLLSLGNSPLGKKLVDYTGAKSVLYPDTIQAAETKRE